eukprot:PhM_4_TR11171/c0_g1_i1/m.54009
MPQCTTNMKSAPRRHCQHANDRSSERRHPLYTLSPIMRIMLLLILLLFDLFETLPRRVLATTNTTTMSPQPTATLPPTARPTPTAPPGSPTLPPAVSLPPGASTSTRHLLNVTVSLSFSWGAGGMRVAILNALLDTLERQSAAVGPVYQLRGIGPGNRDNSNATRHWWFLVEASDVGTVASVACAFPPSVKYNRPGLELKGIPLVGIVAVVTPPRQTSYSFTTPKTERTITIGVLCGVVVAGGAVGLAIGTAAGSVLLAPTTGHTFQEAETFLMCDVPNPNDESSDGRRSGKRRPPRPPTALQPGTMKASVNL